MFTKTITYTDYDGTSRTEEFRFNLSKPEVIKMQLSEEGGFDKMLERIVKAQDTRKIIEVIDLLIAKSYGEKSLDGKRFIKNDEVTEGFLQTPAYDELLLELTTNADALTAFINGIMPQGIDVSHT